MKSDYEFLQPLKPFVVHFSSTLGAGRNERLSLRLAPHYSNDFKYSSRYREAKPNT